MLPLNDVQPVSMTPTEEDLLTNPATSYWLKEQLLVTRRRDPLDAAMDAIILADVMKSRVREMGIDLD